MTVRSPAPSRLRCLFVAALASTLLGPVGVVAADDHLPGEAGEGALARIESAPLIAGLLSELGADAGDVAAFTGELRAGVDERLQALIAEGVLTVDQVEALGTTFAAGNGREHLVATAAEARERRRTFLEASLIALEHLGIEVGEGESVHSVLRTHDLTPTELERILAELDIELPPPTLRPAAVPPLLDPLVPLPSDPSSIDEDQPVLPPLAPVPPSTPPPPPLPLPTDPPPTIPPPTIPPPTIPPPTIPLPTLPLPTVPLPSLTGDDGPGPLPPLPPPGDDPEIDSDLFGAIDASDAETVLGPLRSTADDPVVP